MVNTRESEGENITENFIKRDVSGKIVTRSIIGHSELMQGIIDSK